MQNPPLAADSTGETTPPPGTSTPVNSVQPPSSPDLSGMIAHYEARIRALMSEKDKAINERNAAITAQTQMQQQLTELQTQTQSSLTSAATAAQTAIDQARTSASRVSVLEGELQRAQILLEKPHLAPYAQFLPAQGDADKIKAAVEQLEQIRQQDLDRNRPPLGSSPSPAPTTSPPGNPLVLYGQRAQMAPQLAGSNPAQMHPAGAGNIEAAIQQLFADARTDSSPGAFERAVQQAAVLAESSINQQLGRS